MNNKNYVHRPISILLISVLVLQGCATQNAKGEKLSMGESVKETFASDDPCANNKRNIGILAGAVLGAIIGNKVSDKNKTIATVLGAGLGGGLGGLIGSQLDKRECELYKIQQKYALEMQVTPLAINHQNVSNSQNSSNNTSASDQPQRVGLSVSVIDQSQKPQFLSGSDRLQDNAKLHFSEIAKQYSTEQMLADSSVKSSQEKAELVKTFKKRRVLLIGHTDDTGDSKLNADLSERRAKAVANLFYTNGVDLEQLYYQGAGETMPIADNATELGRAKNRRVEIVDLSDETNFQLYLQNRQPNTKYYRPVENSVVLAEDISVKNSSQVKTQGKLKKEEKPKDIKVVDVTPNRSKEIVAKQQTDDSIDFGGVPYKANLAQVNVGDILRTQTKFNIISEAQAETAPVLSCNMDRPRNTGAVKSLKTGREYATNEYLPGLYGRSWQETVNGNLVVLNNVSVLRDASAPVSNPNVKVYANYNPKKNRNPKPDVNLTPQVNTYRGSNGLLYRVFADGAKGLQCIDMLMPLKGGELAKDGKVIYMNNSNTYVTNFKPKMIR